MSAIDLQRFCARGFSSPYARPSSYGDYSYATDGVIAIRVARRADVAEGAKPLSQRKIEAVFASADARAVAFIGLAGAALPVNKSPYEICKRCHGLGYTPGHDGDDETGDCVACGGHGSSGVRRSIRLGGVPFDADLIEFILSLPGIDAERQPPAGEPMLFRFAGCDGLLMPLSRDYQLPLGDLEDYLPIRTAAGASSGAR